MILLVHSNSNLHAIIVLSPSGFIKIHHVPAPSLDREPSKYKVKNKDLSIGLSKIFTHLDESVYENFELDK